MYLPHSLSRMSFIFLAFTGLFFLAVLLFFASFLFFGLFLIAIPGMMVSPTLLVPQWLLMSATALVAGRTTYGLLHLMAEHPRLAPVVARLHHELDLHH